MENNSFWSREEPLFLESLGIEEDAEFVLPEVRTADKVNDLAWLRNCLTKMEEYVVPLIILTGIVGNTFSFSVFIATHLKRSSCNVYLASLAVADNTFLFCVFLPWSHHIGLSLHIQQGWCQILIYLTHVSSFLSVWYVVSFTVERYVIVCLPDRRARLCTTRVARRVVLLLSVSSLLVYCFTGFASGVIKSYGMSICAPLARYYKVVLALSNVDTFVTLIIPTIVIIGCNIRIILVVCRFSGNGSPSPSQPTPSPALSTQRDRAVHRWNFGEASSRSQRYYSTPHTGQAGSKSRSRGTSVHRATRMLLIVSTVFLVCNLPCHAIRTYILVRQVSDTQYHPSVPVLLWQQFFNIIYYVNFSVNFFLYSLSSRSFRAGIKRLRVKLREKLRACRCRTQEAGSPQPSPRRRCSRSEFAPSAQSLRQL